MALLSYNTVARGDETRAFHLTDILKFEQHTAFKPCIAWVLTLVQWDGKTYAVRSCPYHINWASA
jgi:hypothetical protein